MIVLHFYARGIYFHGWPDSSGVQFLAMHSFCKLNFLSDQIIQSGSCSWQPGVSNYFYVLVVLVSIYAIIDLPGSFIY